MRCWATLGLVLSAAFLVSSGGRAQAAVFVVDSVGDEADKYPGDGYAMSFLGTATLRAAIEEANAWPGPSAAPGRSRNPPNRAAS